MKKTPWPHVRELLLNIDHASNSTIYKKHLDTFHNLLRQTDFTEINKQNIPSYLTYHNTTTKEYVRSNWRASYNPQTTVKPSRKASVLVLFLNHLKQVNVLMMRKTQLNEQINKSYRHGGQFAFPGGMCDTNESNIECALRETHEEVGVPSDMIEIVNDTLPETTTSVGSAPIKGFIALPVNSTQQIEYTIQEKEVDHIYELPLSLLIDHYDPLGLVKVSQSNVRYLKEMKIRNVQTSEQDAIDEYIEGPLFLIESPSAKLSSLSAREPSTSRAEIWGFSARLLVIMLNGLEKMLQEKMISKL
jgi:8-oxo-dGTP pyrophosphatase MutT (NUDIX family)